MRPRGCYVCPNRIKIISNGTRVALNRLETFLLNKFVTVIPLQPNGVFLLPELHRSIAGANRLAIDELYACLGETEIFSFSRFQFLKGRPKTEQNHRRPRLRRYLALLILIKSPPITGKPDII